MDIFGLSMESDVVEELALKLYDELEKIICDNDPMMFSNLICLISNTLEQLNYRIVREKELSEKLQIIKDENEELLRKFRNRGGIIEDKDRMILQCQSEIETFHHEKELLTSDAKLMKKKIIDLNKKIKELEVLADSFESENYFKEEKLKAMERELEKKVISYRNTTLKNQQNSFNNMNSEKKPINAFAVLRRHIRDFDEDISNKLILSSSADNLIQFDSVGSTPTTESTPTEISSNSDSDTIKLDSNPEGNVSVFSDATGKQSNSELTIKPDHNLEINISIFSDASGKELAQLLKKHFSNKCNIMSLVKSNASFLQVVNSCRPESYTENDHVILIFGVTDIDLRKECDIFMKLEPYLALFNRTNVWICTLPYRYDLDPDDAKQNVIQLINNYMKEISVRLSHVRVIDIYGFKQNNFSRDGIYLNAKGKKKLSGLIHKSIKMI